MELNLDERRLTADPPASELIAHLQSNSARMGLDGAQLYYDFPILKDADDRVVVAKILLLSPSHGILVVTTLDTTSQAEAAQVIAEADAELEHLFSLLYSRLIRIPQLRKSRTALLVPAATAVFAPNLPAQQLPDEIEAHVVFSTGQFEQLMGDTRTPPLPPGLFNELVSTVEGAKAIIRAKPRPVQDLGPRSKGVLANKIESEITSFDRRQKHGAMAVLDGLQRIRGLAGSGKTVVLAMKAALTHLRYPEARIVYTFYTKSLYQHIQRLITRFYRQFEDSDPDWSRLHILHGWGGYSTEGVYFNASIANGVPPVSLRDAKEAKAKDPFDYACKKLLESANVNPMYDFILVDEGQDFPASFVQLCIRLAEKNRVIFAYDDLQTIFQASTPAIADIVGVDKDGAPLVDLTEDVVLYKCYRNPREILVCAHALGFGVYANIVQMLENREQWEDLGYLVREGAFVEGSPTVIERPQENSLPTISLNQKPGEIVRAAVYDTFAEEIDATVTSILADIGDGLRPDDILVIVVDDRNARAYLNSVASKLMAAGIGINNIHEDSFGIRDFQKEGEVTLSTVHKAKGNEAFMVYVLGADALYSTYAGVRERNVLFTAMTRAKGWVMVSGVGKPAASCADEIDSALANFPYLKFAYPSQEEQKTIKRDLAQRAIRKQRAERKLDEVLDEMSQEEIVRFLEQRAIKKGKA